MAPYADEVSTSPAVCCLVAGAPSPSDNDKNLPGPRRVVDRGTQTEDLPAPCAPVACPCGRKRPSAAHEDTSSPPTKRRRPIGGTPQPARQESSLPVKGEDDVENQSLLASIPEASRAPADPASPPDQKIQKVIFKWGDRRVVNWRPRPPTLGPSPEPSSGPSPARPPTPDQKMQKVIFKWGDRRVVNWVRRRPVATEEEGPPPLPSPSPRRSLSPQSSVPASPPSPSPMFLPSPPSPPSSPFAPPPLCASVTPLPRPCHSPAPRSSVLGLGGGA